MTRNTGTRLGLVGLALSGLLAAAPAHAIALYRVVNLGTLGGTSSTALGINNSGRIVGYADDPVNGWARATLFNPAGINIDLGTLAGGVSSIAYAINDGGQIVGQATTAGNSTSRATLFNPGGTNFDLGGITDIFGGSEFSAANAINNNGQIVGSAIAANGQMHAALFNLSGIGANVDLGTLGGSFGVAYGINISGQIAGTSTATQGSNVTHTTLFTPGGTNIDRGTGGGNDSGGNAVNDGGQIVGYVRHSSLGTTEASLFNLDGTITSLGRLGGNASSAADINNHGLIVGTSRTATNDQVAFLWDNQTGMRDLNTLIDSTSLDWRIQTAMAINDMGQIAANGCSITTGQCRALLLDVIQSADPAGVPEPAGLWLTSSALMVAGLVGRLTSRRQT